MTLWGLAVDDPEQISTGTIAGRGIRLVTETPRLANSAGLLHERISSGWFEKGMRVVINAVILRSSGEDLTTAGT